LRAAKRDCAASRAPVVIVVAVPFDLVGAVDSGTASLIVAGDMRSNVSVAHRPSNMRRHWYGFLMEQCRDALDVTESCDVLQSIPKRTPNAAMSGPVNDSLQVNDVCSHLSVVGDVQFKNQKESHACVSYREVSERKPYVAYRAS
jgi:hypothetical protein